MKKFSKSLALIMSMLMILSSFSLVGSAINGDALPGEPVGEIYFTDAEGEPGDTINLSLSVRENMQLYSTTVDFAFDEETFELVSYEYTDALPGKSSKPFASTDRFFIWTNDALPNMCDVVAGPLVNLQLKIKDTATPGEYKITPSYIAEDEYIVNVEYEFLKVTMTAGTITVKAPAASNFEVKFMNEGTQVGATQTIASGAFATAPKFPDDFQIAESKKPTSAGYYEFLGWSVDGSTVVNVAETAITAATEFKAVYSAKKDFPEKIVKTYTTGGFPDIVKGEGISADKVVTRTRENFKGVANAYKMAAYTGADAQEGNLSIEGYNAHPQNYTTILGKNTHFDYSIYPYVVVKYYYEPGTNTATRTSNFNAAHYNRNALFKTGANTAPGGNSVALVPGKWTYAVYDFTEKAAACSSPVIFQFQYGMGITRAQAAATGEAFYITDINYFKSAPTINNVKFLNGDGSTAYEVDLLAGEAFTGYYGVEPTKVADEVNTYAFANKWTKDGVEVDLDALTITGDTVLTPVFTATPLTGTTYTVKFVNGADVLYSGDIAENSFVATAVVPANPTKERDANNWYAFDGWYVGETKVADVTAYVITASTTFEARYTATAHKSPLVWNPTSISFVNNKTFYTKSAQSYKGVDSIKIVPNSDNIASADSSLNIEGDGKVPENYSSILKGKSVYLDHRIYPVTVVRYYYEPGESTAERKFKIWNQTSNWQNYSLKRVPDREVTMEGGKWTYAFFDWTGADLSTFDCNSAQFHLRPFDGVNNADFATGETFYLDTVQWFLARPEMYTVTFKNGAEEYVVDVLAGEEAKFYGTTPTGAGEFLGWAKEGTETVISPLVVTEDTTLVPRFGEIEPTVIYVSATGNDANAGTDATAPKLTLKSAVLASASYPKAVVLVKDAGVAGGLGGLNVDLTDVTITSKWGEEDYTATASITYPGGSYHNSTAGTGKITFQDIKITVTNDQQWSFINLDSYEPHFGKGIVVESSNLGTYNLKVRMGGEGGGVDYDRFSGPIVVESGKFGAFHLGSKGNIIINNINFIWNNPVSASLNYGNDSYDGRVATITGHTRIEINEPIDNINHNHVGTNNADLSLIFNNGVTPKYNNAIKSTVDGKKSFIIKAGTGFILHATDTLGTFAIEAKPASKTYYVMNNAETTFGATLVLTDSGEYTLGAYDYKVIFKNGEEVLATKYTDGAVTAPTAPTAPAHKTFAGWAKEGTTEIVDLGAITADVTLVPVFTSIQYAVTFGATEITGVYGAEVVTPEAPTAEAGKQFVCWQNTDDETDTINASTSFTITGNKTYFAVFEDITYTVTFGETSISKKYNETLEVPAYTGTVPAGQVFAGWVSGETTLAVGDTYTVTANATFTAKFVSLTSYAVAFKVGDETVSSVSYYEGDAVVFPTEAPTAPAGKSFAGWAVEGTTEIITSYTVGTSAVTFVAVFEDITYTVTFGETSFSKKYNETLEVPAYTGTVPAGQVFAGWTNGVDTLAVGTIYTVTANATFTAKFDTKPSYAVVFKVGTETVSSVSYYEGDAVVFPTEAPTAPAGKTFAGWAVEGTDTIITSYTVGTSAVAIVAVFEDKPVVVVTIAGVPQNSYEGATITLPETATPAPGSPDEGKRFAGWSTTEGGAIEYAGGAEITVPGSAIEFFPVFTENNAWYEAVGQYTVKTSGQYKVDLYVAGDKMDLLSFGIKYLDTMTLDSFTPAAGFANPYVGVIELDDDTRNIYARGLAGLGGFTLIDASKDEDGDGVADLVHVGTFVFTMDKSDYDATTPADRIAFATLEATDSLGLDDVNMYVGGKYTYIPHTTDTGVTYLPIELEMVTDLAVIETAVEVQGTYNATNRASDAGLKKASLNIYTGHGAAKSAVAIQTIELNETADKVTAYSVELTEGEYTFEFVKIGYLTETVEVTVVEGMAAVAEVKAYAGDIRDAITGKDEKIDLNDFARLIRGFDDAVKTADYIKEADLDENEDIDLDDLEILKTNFGMAK